MDRKTLTIILSAALLVSFFLPLINVMGIISVSSFDAVFGKMGEGGEASRFILLIFPLVALLLLIGAVNKDKYLIDRSILVWIPLITIVGLIIYAFVESKGRGGEDGESLGSIFSMLGIGFWLIVVVSLLLPFLKGKVTVAQPVDHEPEVQP